MDVLSRWDNPDSYSARWDARAEFSAKLIPAGCVVADIGCGPLQPLRRFLPARCTYLPFDLKPWSAEVTRVDLTAGEFPTGPFDVVVFLGVAEHLPDFGPVAQKARNAARQMIVSFHHPTLAVRLLRWRSRWLSRYTSREFARLLSDAGWSIAEQKVYSRSRKATQIVYRCDLKR